MPIEVIGQTACSERDAGEELARLLAPIVSDKSHVNIVVGAKCYGQRRQDIDLLVLASFAPPIPIPRGSSRSDSFRREHVLSTLALVLEVKDHRPSDVRFVGNHVQVTYDGQWRDVTSAVWEQRFSVREFLRRAGHPPPFVHSAIWLRNCPRADLPQTAHNILPAGPTLDDFFKLLILLHGVVRDSGTPQQAPEEISCGLSNQADVIHAAALAFCKELRPSELDRRKLERICERQVRDAQYLANLGRQLLIFKGRGGVGKTFRLLQLAKHVHDHSSARVLFLTYNRALAADVRRLLAILRIRDKTNQATIRVSTSEAFFWSLLKAFDMAPALDVHGVFPTSDYVCQKERLLELVRSASPDEIRADPVAARNPEAFLWDFVCIDEGQDWPSVERDLLVALFGADRLVVADGVDQLVRGTKRCDWPSVAPRRRQIVTLRKSMRLKANLCRFVSTVAGELGANWDMEPDPGISGGRVIVLRGAYSEVVHKRVIDEHIRLGNAPIDFLFCITGSTSSDSVKMPNRLQKWGHLIWNGADEAERDSYPTDTRQIRIVKYESVRGLEGWTVVCLDLERFFARQRSAELTADRDLLMTADEAAAMYAAQWALIPMTRAVDTLVLQIRDNSEFSSAILRAQELCSDFCEVVGPSEDDVTTVD